MIKISQLISFSISLIIVITALLITYYFVSKKLPNSFGGRFGKVVSRIYIDRNTQIVLVRILKEYYVILVSPNHSTLIKKLDTMDESEIGLEEPTKSFKDIFYKKVGDGK